jgi:hypothetical protein
MMVMITKWAQLSILSGTVIKKLKETKTTSSLLIKTTRFHSKICQPSKKLRGIIMDQSESCSGLCLMTRSAKKQEAVQLSTVKS